MVDDRPVDQRTATRFRSRSATPREVTHVGSNQLAPEGAHVRNPSFDVTPAKYITAIITERGVYRAPFEESLKSAIGD